MWQGGLDPPSNGGTLKDVMLRFVHLSDIHFSNRVAKFGFDPDRELRNRVLEDIGAMTGRLGPATAVLVTGDIAYAGQRAEYEDAAQWLDRVCDASKCGREEVFVCPGNHDIDHGVISDNSLIQDGHDAVRRLDNPYDRSRALSALGELADGTGIKERRANRPSDLSAPGSFLNGKQSVRRRSALMRLRTV